MKYFFLFFLTVSLYCQSGSFLPGTAHTIPEGRWEIGLFQPVRWGQSESRELLFYKLSSLLMPNITIKQRWYKAETLALSTVHTLLYPSPLMKTLQSPLGKEAGAPNMFALISPEFEIPSMIILNNTVVTTWPLEKGRALTGKVGLAISLGGSNLATESSIDLPLVYHRLAVLYNGWSLRLGVDLNGGIGKNLFYLIDGDLFLIPGIKGNRSFEHKGMLTWERSPRFHVSLGYKFIYGVYPDGYPNKNISRVHILPLFDLQWAWG